jgi:hypothetical protein
VPVTVAVTARLARVHAWSWPGAGARFKLKPQRGPVPVSPFVGAGRLPFWVDLIFKSAFQKTKKVEAPRAR